MNKKISVVICTYNGISKIGDLLEALRIQSLDKKDFEVCVVDDGSKISVKKLVDSYGYKYIRNQKNIGLAASRNVGYLSTSAPIVAFTDDDCVPDRDWLEKTLLHFTDPLVDALSGYVYSAKTESLAEKYIDHTQPLKPLSLSLSQSSSPWYRLFLYFLRQFEKEIAMSKPCEISAVVGASMAFRREVLVRLSGFDVNFRFGGEEEELCYRYSKFSKKNKLMYFPDIRVKHKFDRELYNLLKKNFAYGRGNARIKKKFPERSITLYPFPLVIIVSLLLVLITPIFIFFTLLFIYLLYPRWTLLSLSQKNLKLLFFPFVQFSVELAHNLGWTEEIILNKDK